MTRTWNASFGPPALFVLAATGLLGAAQAILGSAGYQAQSHVVGPALAVDLTLGLPLLGYLLLVRPGRLDALMLVPLALGGLFLARWWIPASDLGSSALGMAPVLIAEGLVMGLLVLRARAVLAAFRLERARHPYPRDAWRAALGRVAGPRLAGMILGETEALHYAVAGWRRPVLPAGGVAVPGHRRGGYPAVLGALLLVVAVETVGVHLVVAAYAPVGAVVLTALGIYSVLWLVGDLNAARHNPTLLRGGVLHLRAGLRARIDLPIQQIRAVHRTAPSGPAAKILLWGTPDFWVECRDPVEVEGPLGLRRRTRILAVGVDEPGRLLAALEADLTDLP